MKDKEKQFRQECSLIANGEDLPTDKEMIEEMAKDIEQVEKEVYSVIVKETHAYVKEHHKYNSKEDYSLAHIKTVHERTAEDMFNLGYRKIPKDSVVLSREEAERFRGQTINIAKVKSQERKETAEKFMGIRKYIIEQFHKYHEARNSAETHFNLAKRKSDINVSNIDWHRADAIMIILESVAVMFDEVAEQFGFQIKE